MAVILGFIALMLAFASYAYYFRDIFRGKTKPNVTTRLIWTLLNLFIFIQQVIHDGGPGAWVTGFAALANLIIFILAFHYGERKITVFDWICLTIALLSLAAWLLTTNTELAVVLACSVFIIGLIPTIHKSRLHAFEETAISYGLNSLKFFIALFALTSVTLVTALYPLVLGIVNGLFFVYLLSRQSSTRRQMESDANPNA
jgi:hypothetical protein